MPMFEQYIIQKYVQELDIKEANRGLLIMYNQSYPIKKDFMIKINKFLCLNEDPIDKIKMYHSLLPANDQD